MSQPSALIEKVPVQAFRYQGKCPKCRRVIKGPSLKLAESNLVHHIEAHDRAEEEKRQWVARYTSKVEA